MQKSEKEISDPTIYLEQLFMQAPLSFILLLGRDLIIKLVNQRAINFSGWSREQMLERPFFEVFPELVNQGFKEATQWVLDNGQPLRANELPLQLLTRKESGIEYINLVLEPLKNAEGKTIGIIGVATDITAMVNSRKQVEESEMKYRKLFESMSQGFYILELIMDDNNNPIDYRYLEVNPAFSKVSDYHDVVGKTIREVAPDYADYWIREFSQVALTGESKIVLGEANKWYEAYAFPVGPAGSNKIGVIFTDKDETVKEKERQQRFAEDLQKEVKAQTRELKRSNKELLHFARLTSHDLKEPVRKIETFVRRLMNEHDSLPAERRKHFYDRILVSIERIKKMIMGVQNYTQIENTGYVVEDIDLNTIILSIRNDLESFIKSKSAVFMVDNLPVIQGSRMLIYQLFFNLISNSLKFSKADEIAEITITSNKRVIQDEEFVNILISDKGIGFGSDKNEVIFDTFSRLHPKDSYEGTGLGLALSRRIAERHGGMITASGTENVGSTFCVMLPVRQKRSPIHKVK